MTGKVSTLEDGTVRILFPADKFAALMQRIICLAGRMDTNGFMKEFARLTREEPETTVGFVF